MPAAKPKPRPTFRVEYLVRAVVAVEVEADSLEAALTVAKENERKWPLEGIKSEVCESNTLIAGVSDTRAWRAVDQEVR